MAACPPTVGGQAAISWARARTGAAIRVPAVPARRALPGSREGLGDWKHRDGPRIRPPFWIEVATVPRGFGGAFHIAQPSKPKSAGAIADSFPDCARTLGRPNQSQVQGRTPAASEVDGILGKPTQGSSLGGSRIPACAAPWCVPVRISWARLHPRNPGRAAFDPGSDQRHRSACVGFEPQVNRETTFADIPCLKLRFLASPDCCRWAEEAGSRMSPGLGASFQRCYNRTPQQKMNTVEANARPIDECTPRTVATTVPPGRPKRCAEWQPPVPPPLWCPGELESTMRSTLHQWLKVCDVSAVSSGDEQHFDWG